MSQQDFVNFVKAVSTDPAMQKRIKDIAGGTMQEKVAALIAFGRELGFTFSERDVDQQALAGAADSGDELGLDALEKVAGGVIGNIMKTKHDTAKNAINNLKL